MEKWLEEQSKSLLTYVQKFDVEMRAIEESIRNKERTQGMYGQFKPQGDDNIPDFYQPPMPNFEQQSDDINSQAESSEEMSMIIEPEVMPNTELL